MNEYQETYEKEISLIELMFYCLKKWRWIVASMLILAVLAGGYKYQATVKGNALKKEAEALGEEELPAEALGEEESSAAGAPQAAKAKTITTANTHAKIRFIVYTPYKLCMCLS